MPETKRKAIPRITVTTYHEAGHAVMAYLVGWRFRSVSVEPDPDASTLGRLVTVFPDWFQPSFERDHRHDRQIERQVQTLYGGVVAVHKLTGKWDWDSGRIDRKLATDLCYCGYGAPKVATAFAKLQFEICRAELENNKNWQAVKALAEALLKKPNIPSREAKRIMYEAMTTPEEREVDAKFKKSMKEFAQRAKVQRTKSTVS